MATGLSDAQVADLIEELTLLRAGKPFHTHRDVASGSTKRCSSPYCVDLTFAGIREEPVRA